MLSFLGEDISFAPWDIKQMTVRSRIPANSWARKHRREPTYITDVNVQCKRSLQETFKLQLIRPSEEIDRYMRVSPSSSSNDNSLQNLTSVGTWTLIISTTPEEEVG